ncbi:MAG: membrane metalloprotease [Flavobacteriaceae bacterium]|nr:membrane metalloprotease [Flavobacteriaceae bacterium]
MKNLSSKLVLVFTLSILLLSCKSDDSGDSAIDPHAENLKVLGASAEDILSDDIYKNINIEIAYATGFRPKDETLTLFRTLLENRLNKPGNIHFIETEITTPLDSSLTLDEIKNLESTHRTEYTSGNDIAVYIYFANGNSSNDTSTSVTLGTAYRNTSIVIFEKTLLELQISQGSDLLVLEATTTQHEFGHILGLVNLSDDDIHPTNHEDTAHPNHCVVENCLMYFESTNFRSLRGKTSVPEFDALCIADLQAKGGK